MVEFQTYNDMKRAIEKLDGTEINGRKIKMIPDKQSHRSSSRRRSVILIRYQPLKRQEKNASENVVS